MVSILAKTLNQKKGVLFIEPYILNKDTLVFKDNTLAIKSFFNIKNKSISIELASKVYDMPIDADDVKVLKNFHQKELVKATNYLNSMRAKQVEMWISGDTVCNKQLIDTCFNPYYVQLTLYALNELFKTKILKLDDFKENLMKKTSKLKEYEKYGEFTVITL